MIILSPPPPQVSRTPITVIGTLLSLRYNDFSGIALVAINVSLILPEQIRLFIFIIKPPTNLIINRTLLKKLDKSDKGFLVTLHLSLTKYFREIMEFLILISLFILILHICLYKTQCCHQVDSAQLLFQYLLVYLK